MFAVTTVANMTQPQLDHIARIFEQTASPRKLLTKHSGKYLPVYSVQAFDEANKPFHWGVTCMPPHERRRTADPPIAALLRGGEVRDPARQAARGRDGRAAADGLRVARRRRRAVGRQQVRGGGRPLPPAAGGHTPPQYRQQPGIK